MEQNMVKNNSGEFIECRSKMCLGILKFVGDSEKSEMRTMENEFRAGGRKKKVRDYYRKWKKREKEY